MAEPTARAVLVSARDIMTARLGELGVPWSAEGKDVYPGEWLIFDEHHDAPVFDKIHRTDAALIVSAVNVYSTVLLDIITDALIRLDLPTPSDDESHGFVLAATHIARAVVEEANR